MAIITIVSASYCHGDEIVSQVIEQLGYERLDDLVLSTAAEKFNLDRDKLRHALNGSGPFKYRQSKDRDKLLACLEVALAEVIQRDDGVITGMGGYLIPGNIAHILRVCLVADLPYRVAQAVSSEGLSEDQAHERIKDYDQQLVDNVMSLVSRSVYDENLYDMMLPVDRSDVAATVKLICEQASSDAVRPTDWSRIHAQDFLLSARVKQVLTDAGHNVEVFSENGRVTIGINERAFMMSRLQEKLKRMAREIEGVTDVETKLGTRYTAPSINPWEDIDAGPKVLLVDDEKEFVQTLSQRLKTRNLESSIAYDGEQALDMLKEDVPDVIVLDLLMPGIDGIETLRRVKQSHPDVEVIILTGHGSDREQEEAEDLGAFAYLRKPVNVNELAQLMREAYSRRQRRNQDNG
ncbi:MAG TPA: response regulator [candidate division Zixibacteria bacterium]|nr:response regulator [candidate division Zixibacteria bacterium]